MRKVESTGFLLKLELENSKNTIKVFEKFADKCRERFTNKHDGNREKYLENQ